MIVIPEKVCSPVSGHRKAGSTSSIVQPGSRSRSA
jgi:hypothetical protein